LYYSKDNVFYKQDLDRDKVGRLQFYDVQLGDLTSVDLINPLKILLFYRDTQTVVLLDNRLNESLRISLDNLQPYRFIQHAQLAGERRLWLYNQDLQRLEIYDYINDRTLVSSPVIEQDVLYLLTDYNFCHVVTANAVLSYNSYASRTGKLSLTSPFVADYDFERLAIIHENDLRVYRFNKEYKLVKTEIPEPIMTDYQPQSIYLKNGNLYLYRQDQLSILNINDNQK
jgi:hypothetical protein